MPNNPSAKPILQQPDSEITEQAMRLLIRVLKDPKQPTDLRLEAAKGILTYAKLLGTNAIPDGALDQIASLPITSLH